MTEFNNNNKYVSQVPKTYEQFVLEQQQLTPEQQRDLYPDLGYEDVSVSKGYGACIPYNVNCNCSSEQLRRQIQRLDNDLQRERENSQFLREAFQERRQRQHQEDGEVRGEQNNVRMQNFQEQINVLTQEWNDAQRERDARPTRDEFNQALSNLQQITAESARDKRELATYKTSNRYGFALTNETNQEFFDSLTWTRSLQIFYDGRPLNYNQLDLRKLEFSFLSYENTTCHPNAPTLIVNEPPSSFKGGLTAYYGANLEHGFGGFSWLRLCGEGTTGIYTDSIDKIIFRDGSIGNRENYENNEWFNYKIEKKPEPR